MNNRILSLAVVAIAAFQTKAQVTEIRTVDAFHGLKIQSAIEVKYTPSATTEIKITAGEKYINDIKAVTVNGVLELYYDGNRNFQNQDDIKADISGPVALDFIEMTGAASFKNSDTLRPEKFKYDFSGASSGNVTLITPMINGEISGAASAKLFGKAAEARHQASGAASLKAYELYSNKVKVSASGAASARVRAMQEISGDASGAASLYFKGNPEKQDLETSGAGSVKKVLDDGSNAGNSDRRKVETTPGDTNKSSQINIGGTIITIHDKHDKKDKDDDEKKREKKEKNYKFADDNWSGLEFGIPGYLNNGSFQPSGKIGTRDMANLELNYGKSRHWAWNIADWNVKIIKHNLEFTTGVGLAWDNYAFRKAITLKDDSSFVSYSLDTAKYSYNKLRVNSIQVPLLLSFNTSGNEDKTFRITAGAVLGWNYRSRVIQEYTLAKDNFEYERKSKTNFGVVNPFKVMLQGSVGYGRFNVFSTYNITELFETNNKNPKLLPITFGLRISI
jgi:Putative auto-transporter adhesin, head GIN domain/Outer membrane protein beta-barrel domain